MAKKLDPRLIEIFKRYDMSAEGALWDCHGTWVAYHRAIEEIAAKAGVSFSRPEIIEASTKDGIVSLLCFGKLGDREEWSVGECSPKNNKNSYPYAMAEKRAKDRVVLKLVGLHGLVYSEEESDDFKEKPNSSAQLKRDGVWQEFEADLSDVTSIVMLEKFKTDMRERAKAEHWNRSFLEAAKDAIEGKEAELTAKLVTA